MFLHKQKRLTTKDIRYMLRRRKMIFTYFLSCLRIPQYPNKKYHQLSINIGLIYSKSAVKRRALKRQLLVLLQKKIDTTASLGGKYYKLFFSLNKKNVPDLLSRIDGMSQKDFVLFVSNTFEKDFMTVIKKLS